MGFKLEFNVKGLDALGTDNTSTNKEITGVGDFKVKQPEIRITSKNNLGTRKHTYKVEDIKLVNSPTRIPKSTYPIILYVNHDEIDLTNEWGWVCTFRLFCDYCALKDHDRYLMLGDTKRAMGLCISRTREDLLVNAYTDNKKIVNMWDLWFNLDVPSKRDLGVAIFNIGDFMGFKYIAMELKKWDNSEFSY